MWPQRFEMTRKGAFDAMFYQVLCERKIFLHFSRFLNFFLYIVRKTGKKSKRFEVSMYFIQFLFTKRQKIKHGIQWKCIGCYHKTQDIHHTRCNSRNQKEREKKIWRIIYEMQFGFLSIFISWSFFLAVYSVGWSLERLLLLLSLFVVCTRYDTGSDFRFFFCFRFFFSIAPVYEIPTRQTQQTILQTLKNHRFAKPCRWWWFFLCLLHICHAVFAPMSAFYFPRFSSLWISFYYYFISSHNFLLCCESIQSKLNASIVFVFFFAGFFCLFYLGYVRVFALPSFLYTLFYCVHRCCFKNRFFLVSFFYFLWEKKTIPCFSSTFMLLLSSIAVFFSCSNIQLLLLLFYIFLQACLSKPFILILFLGNVDSKCVVCAGFFLLHICCVHFAALLRCLLHVQHFFLWPR